MSPEPLMSFQHNFFTGNKIYKFEGYTNLCSGTPGPPLLTMPVFLKCFFVYSLCVIGYYREIDTTFKPNCKIICHLSVNCCYRNEPDREIAFRKKRSFRPFKTFLMNRSEGKILGGANRVLKAKKSRNMGSKLKLGKKKPFWMKREGIVFCIISQIVL